MMHSEGMPFVLGVKRWFDWRLRGAFRAGAVGFRFMAGAFRRRDRILRVGRTIVKFQSGHFMRGVAKFYFRVRAGNLSITIQMSLDNSTQCERVLRPARAKQHTQHAWQSWDNSV
jgi:hypothetical protein